MIQQLYTAVPTRSVRRDKRLLLTSLVIPILFIFFFFFRWAVEIFRYSIDLRFVYELGNLLGLVFQLGLMFVSLIFTIQLYVKRKHFNSPHVVRMSLLLSAFPILYFTILLLLLLTAV